MSGHIRDLWQVRDPGSGRRVRGPRWGKGKRWQAVAVRADGTRATSTHETRATAELWLARAQSEKQLVAPRVAFSAAAEEWLASQHQMRPQSRRSAGDKVGRMLLPSLGALALTEITRPRLQALANDLAARYSPASVRVAWSHLRGILTAAHLDELIPSLPTVGVRLPRASERRVVPLTDDQVRAVMEAAPERIRAMVLLAAASGLRPGEWAGLTWDRVSDTAVRVDRQLIDTEGGKPIFGPPKSAAGFRVVGVGKAVIDELRALRERHGEGPEGLVLVSPRGRPMSRHLRQETWARYRSLIDGRPGQSWHQLRHYHASKLIAEGVSVVAVAARLGHRDVTETLSTYAHLWPGDEGRMESVAVAVAESLSAK